MDDVQYLYPVGVYQIPYVWKSRWLQENDESAAFREKLRALADMKNTYLLLDNSGEAIDSDQIEIFVEIFNLIRYPLHHVIFLTSNPLGAELSNVASHFGMIVVGAHFFEALSRSFLVPDLPLLQQLAFGELRKPERLFLALNRRPKWHRLLLAAIAGQATWKDDVFLSFGGIRLEPEHTDWSSSVPQAVTVAAGMKNARLDENDIAALISKGPVNLDLDFSTPNDTGTMAYHSNESVATFFLRSFMSLVTETSYTSNVFGTFLTEKTFKAIAFCHPFILFSAPGSLAELRSLGYVTFSPWIDERYDEIEDPGRRFDATIGCIETTHQLLLSRDLNILGAFHERAVHNHNNFFRNTANRLQKTLHDIELAFSRIRTLGFSFADTDGGQIVAKGAVALKFSTCAFAILSGFYGLEGQRGRWCGSVGRLSLRLPKGNWNLALQFNKGVGQNPPIFIVNGVRAKVAWRLSEIDQVSLDIMSSSSPIDISIHSRSIYVPSDAFTDNNDDRMLGVFMLDTFMLSHDTEFYQDADAVDVISSVGEGEDI